MIASLHGTVVDKGLDSVVVECGGVGYLCQATPRTLAELPGGAEVTVLTTMVVREDAMTLYAFSDAASREIFALVQTVSGVGARNALALLSVLTPGEIAGAVADGDVKALQRAPGSVSGSPSGWRWISRGSWTPTWWLHRPRPHPTEVPEQPGTPLTPRSSHRSPRPSPDSASGTRRPLPRSPRS